ncbi:MAG: lysoplasmalogenase [Clostridiales bacterium]|nr:lysoplasmalogenase [Clostridiales bacterium]
MKKYINFINYLMMAVILGLDIWYILQGGLWLKTLTSSIFVLLGIINLIYAIKSKCSLKFPIILVVALAVAMAGDVVINIDFMSGAIIFALGHVFYIIAYSFIEKFEWKNLIFASAIFVPSLLIILLLPVLNFDESIMKVICCIYALIISIMVGKAIANYLKDKSLCNLMILIGSALFFISDFMLLLDVFGHVNLTGLFCLLTYYPGQILIAYSVKHYVEK